MIVHKAKITELVARRYFTKLVTTKVKKALEKWKEVSLQTNNRSSTYPYRILTEENEGSLANAATALHPLVSVPRLADRFVAKLRPLPDG